MNRNKAISLSLKILLGSYILFCLIIAGLNYGVSPKAEPATAGFIADIWHFYENEYKTFLILICSVLSLMLIRKNEQNRMRRRNYTGFIISALIVHIIGPVITGSKEMYFFSMPLPWSSLSVQVFDGTTVFHENFTSHWGTAGLGALLIFVILYNIVIITGTLLFGRRLQCSQVCLFNGFASEIFAGAFPFFGKKKKKAGPKLRQVFTVLRIILFASALFFTLTAVLSAAGIIETRNNALLYSIETIRYLSVELLMAMFFWVVFTGRGYCYYCPAGTLIAFISRAAGQKIRTDLDKCINCGKCDNICAMSVSISEHAAAGKPVTDVNCVGCGHCVDVCPTKTLEYTTYFLELLRSRRKNRQFQPE